MVIDPPTVALAVGMFTLAALPLTMLFLAATPRPSLTDGNNVDTFTCDVLDDPSVDMKAFYNN